jgi:hypothetical protein
LRKIPIDLTFLYGYEKLAYPVILTKQYNYCIIKYNCSYKNMNNCDINGKYF